MGEGERGREGGREREREMCLQVRGQVVLPRLSDIWGSSSSFQCPSVQVA